MGRLGTDGFATLGRYVGDIIGWTGDTGGPWDPHLHARVSWGESLPYNGQPYNGQPYNGQPYGGQSYGGQSGLAERGPSSAGKRR